MNFILYAVAVHPSENVVLLPNSNYSFTCRLVTTNPSVSVTSIEWLLNGTALGNRANVQSDFSSVGGLGLGLLSFVHVPLEYNSTDIQCVATINPSRSREESTSPVTTLLVQGIRLSAADLVKLASEIMTIPFISLVFLAPPPK